MEFPYRFGNHISVSPDDILASLVAMSGFGIHSGARVLLSEAFLATLTSNELAALFRVFSRLHDTS
jgi:hypothetical protein